MAGEWQYPYPPPEWLAPELEAQQALHEAGPPTGLEYPYPPPDWSPEDQANAALLAQPVAPMPPEPSTPEPPPKPVNLPPPTQEEEQLGEVNPEWRPTTYEDMGPRPEGYDNEVDYDVAKQREDIAAQTEIDAGIADAEARGAVEAAEFADLQYKNDLAAEEKRRDFLNTKMQEIDRDFKALENAEIDDSQWYDNQSTGKKIGWAIAAGLAGALAVTQGRGGNEILDMIKDLNAKNLEAQKANLANKRDVLQERRGFYAQLLAQMGDERAADMAFFAMGLERGAKQVAAETAKFKNPQARVKGEAAYTGLVIEARELKKQAAEKAALNKLNEWEARARIGIARDANAIRREELAAQERARQDARDAADAKLAGEERKLVVRDPQGLPMVGKDGKPILATRFEVAEEQNAKTAAAYQFYKDLEAYADKAERAGREFAGARIVPGSDAYSELETDQTMLMTSFKQAYQLGALDKGAIETFNKIVSPPETWSRAGNPAVKARAAAKNVKAQANRDFRLATGYQGDYIDEYEAKVPFKKDATKAANNRQGWKRENPWFVGDDGVVNREGRGRPATDAEVKEHNKRVRAQHAREADEYRLETWKAENRKQPDAWKRAQNAKFKQMGREAPFPEVP